MRWHLMSEIHTRGFDNVLEDAINEAREGAEFIYLSVDIDVLDPAFAPEQQHQSQEDSPQLNCSQRFSGSPHRSILPGWMS